MFSVLVMYVTIKSFTRSNTSVSRPPPRPLPLLRPPSGRSSFDLTVVAQLVVPTTGSALQSHRRQCNLLQTRRRLSRQQTFLSPPRLASKSSTISLLPPQSSQRLSELQAGALPRQIQDGLQPARHRQPQAQPRPHRHVFREVTCLQSASSREGISRRISGRKRLDPMSSRRQTICSQMKRSARPSGDYSLSRKPTRTSWTISLRSQRPSMEQLTQPERTRCTTHASSQRRSGMKLAKAYSK